MKTIRKLLSWIQGFPVITLALLIGLLGATIYLCFRNSQLRSQLSRYKPQANSSVTVQTIKRGSQGKEEESSQKTEVASTDAKFTVVPDYSGQLMPSRILYWDSQITSADAARATDQGSAKTSPDSTSNPSSFYFRDFGFSGLPTSWEPSQDSLAQLLFDRKTLEMSFYNEGVHKYLTKSYDLDLERYQYNWTPSSGLTYQKKQMLEIAPYLQVRHQVFHKVTSVGTGLSFKTRKLDYNIGFSLTRDPKVEPTIRPDLEVSITYKFNKWLR